jgi:hypothetical protein
MELAAFVATRLSDSREFLAGRAGGGLSRQRLKFKNAVARAGLTIRKCAADIPAWAYYADRAEQCRKWLFDLRYGGPVDAGHIAGGLAEFEAIV